MSFNPNGSGGISGASDVALSNPANNDALTYNSTTQKWRNATITKAQVGLANVDNTSDVSKPISTAMQAALSDRLIWRGAFVGGTAYAVNDVVTANGASYRCQTAHTAGVGAPPVNGDVTYWERIGTVSGMTTSWNVRPVIYANGSTTWPAGRTVPAGYAGPVTWDSMAYPGHPAPTAMVTGDDWLQRLS